MHNEGRKKAEEYQAETAPNASSLNYSTPRLSAEDATDQKPKRIVEVEFSELEDGTLLEMIENPQDATKSLLAIWNNGQVGYVEKLERGNQVLVPVPKDAKIIRHVRLADGAESFDSVMILLEDIIVVLRATLELSIDHAFLLASFVLSTWLVEKLPIAPYLALVGPPGSGKTTALRVLNLLCRRSLLTADISSAAFYEVCDRMITTILIDEAATVTNRRELFHLLRAGTTQGFIAVRKRNSFKSYGARVVSWIELPNDPALNSRCILIPMKSCTRTDLLLPTDPRVIHLAKKLQRQLLQFRLENYKTQVLPRITEEEKLQPRTRDLFRALAQPLGEEKEICEALLALLKRQEPLRDVLSAYQSAVLESLYDVIHAHPELSALKLSKLAECVNANLREKGEVGDLMEKRVGNILTSLHLTNRQRLNSGYVLRLDRETRKEIHSQARTYWLNAGPRSQMSATCELCQITGVSTADGSTPKSSENSERVEAKSSRERGEHHERVKRRNKRKPRRAIPAANSRRL
jgi:2-oxo-4-hydroxy-4-carboxy--5-ureidoimidazoline (OHCU) decarboxylase